MLNNISTVLSERDELLKKYRVLIDINNHLTWDHLLLNKKLNQQQNHISFFQTFLKSVAFSCKKYQNTNCLSSKSLVLFCLKCIFPSRISPPNLSPFMSNIYQMSIQTQSSRHDDCKEERAHLVILNDEKEVVLPIFLKGMYTFSSL